MNQKCVFGEYFDEYTASASKSQQYAVRDFSASHASFPFKKALLEKTDSMGKATILLEKALHSGTTIVRGNFGTVFPDKNLGPLFAIYLEQKRTWNVFLSSPIVTKVQITDLSAAACEFPRLPKNELASLADQAGDAAQQLTMREYESGLNSLHTITGQVRNLVLSKDLREDLSDALGALADSVDECERLVFEGIRNPSVEQRIADEGIVDFLNGFQRVLNEFSRISNQGNISVSTGHDASS